MKKETEGKIVLWVIRLFFTAILLFAFWVLTLIF